MNRRPTSLGLIILFLLALIALIALIALSGCSGDSGRPDAPQNNAPTIVSCTADQTTVPAGETVTLSVDAVDEDGDPLSYAWTADGGAFPDGNEGETVTWSPPDQMGTYTVTVTVNDGTDTTDETIDLDVTIPEVVIDPTTLDFGGETTSLQFSVSNDGDGVLNWSATIGSGWMSLDPAAGDLAAGLDETVTVTVDRAGLAPGSHEGAVTVTTPFGEGVVTIHVDVPAVPALAVSTRSMDFGADSVESSFEITNTGNGELEWTATDSGDWLAVNPAEGTTSVETEIIGVTVDRSGLAPGAYDESVEITSNGGQVTIAVHLQVAAPPALVVSTQSLDFDTVTVELPFTVSNSGDGELTWTATSSMDWLDVAPAAGDTRDETDAVSVTVDRTGLSEGEHQGAVHIASNGGAASVTVTLTVPAPLPPAVALSPLTLDFGTTTVQLGIEVSNAGDGTLAWTADSTDDFIDVSPGSGDAVDDTDVITVTVDRSGLPQGQHTGHVTVSGNGTNETATVLVSVPGDTPSLTNIFFLHHSTGRNLINEGSVRSHLANINGDLDFWDHDYNYGCGSYCGLRNPSGSYVGYDYDIPGAPCGNTDPDGLYYLWTSSNSARTKILADHEVIAFKSCYPASHIYSDSELSQRKQWYLAMRDVFDQHPDKIFVVMSHPPLRRSLTNTTEADRSRNFANWLKSDAYLAGHDNIVCFDFFDLLAHPDDGSSDRNMLKSAYQRGDPSDSHPNTLANQTVGPHFADALAAAAALGATR